MHMGFHHEARSETSGPELTITPPQVGDFIRSNLSFDFEDDAIHLVF